MRSRQRLIEVLDSVNPKAVTFLDKCTCQDMSLLLRGEWYDSSIINLAINATHPRHSPHIRELLAEGLAILEADKLTGCSAS